MANVDPIELLKDRYRVEERVGAGGIATVYRAFDIEANRDVALKAISADQVERDHNVLVRFDSELSIGVKLTHPNIIKVFDFGTAPNGSYFIVMEFADGGTFADRIREMGKPPSFIEVLRWLLQIAEGLAFAHGENVIHRDLKPENVLFTAEGMLKIADFGLARDLQLGHTLTQTGETVGTPYYMSPEQLRRTEALDHRTDIYSFGIMAFEAVTGLRPFISENYQELAAKHMIEKMPQVQSHLRGAEIPAWYQDFIEVCAAKRREDRFQSMQEVVRLLSRRLNKLEKAAAGSNGRMSFMSRLRSYFPSRSAAGQNVSG